MMNKNNGNGMGKVKNRFTSYLEESVQASDDVLQSTLKPRLLTGEQEVARASRVLLYPPIYNLKENQRRREEDNATAAIVHDDAGVEGLLVITNFKLTFVTTEESQNSNLIYQENLLLGKDDVTLSNIDQIFQVVDKKKKLLSSDGKISSRIDFLVVVCKNFRLLRFGFGRSEQGKGKHIAEALFQFAFHNRLSLSFSFCYTENYYNTLRNMSMFDKKPDWTQELVRCGAARNYNYKDWRVLSVENETKLPNGSLPLNYIVPKALADCDYLRAAEKFRDSRNAIWVYGYETASLVRMAEQLPDIPDNRTENAMIECIRACHPNKRPPFLLELSKYLPSIQDIADSYKKLRQLCTPDSAKLFSQQDDKFLKSLENSNWLLYVSLFLQVSDETARRMRCQGETVILQENDGRDQSCIVSSLAQVMLDPYYRTINGFQSLIQKEWIALGHPFADRLGHIVNGAATEISPLFLIFLDCVWQLTGQFPEEFEFTETYLTTIWDSAFIPIFDTFQFNCEHDRLNAKLNKLVLRPVWDWGEQFADKDILFFTNPLYRRNQQLQSQPPMESVRKSIVPSSAVQLPITSVVELRTQTVAMGVGRPMSVNMAALRSNTNATIPIRTYLEPKFTLRDMELWRQCYYRWLPIVEIQNGGYAQVELFHRLLLSNINKLQTALQTQDFDDVPPRIISPMVPPPKVTTTDGGDMSKKAVAAAAGMTPAQIMPSVNSFFPFSRNNLSDPAELTDILNLSNELLLEGSIFDTLSQTQIEHP